MAESSCVAETLSGGVIFGRGDILGGGDVLGGRDVLGGGDILGGGVFLGCGDFLSGGVIFYFLYFISRWWSHFGWWRQRRLKYFSTLGANKRALYCAILPA